MSKAPQAAMIAVNMHGQDPMLDIPWPQIQGNQAVFIERITLAGADLEILGSQIERELYLFGGTAFTGEVHPEYGRLRRVHYLVIEKQLHSGALIYHPLSQNEGVMFSRKGEDTERACVDMLKKKRSSSCAAHPRGRRQKPASLFVTGNCFISARKCTFQKPRPIATT